MEHNQSNDGSQGSFPGGNNAPYQAGCNPYLMGYQMPQWCPPQGLQHMATYVPPQGMQHMPANVAPQGLQHIPTTFSMMHPTSNYAQGLPPSEMGGAAVENEEVDVEEVPAPGHTRKGRKKRAGIRTKLSNFSPSEDKILVKSYAEIGEDPITNTGQKRERFWERITERYNLERGENPERTLRSLQSRFEIIKTEVAKFTSQHAEVIRQNPSGMTDADKTTRAAAIFAGVEGHNFAYLHCWEIMKHMPKFQDSKGKTSASGAGFGEDAVLLGEQNADPTSSAGKRPIGRDSAKAAKKKANSDAGSSSSAEYASRMENLSLQRNSLMQEESVRKNERFQHLSSIEEKRLECEQERIRLKREKQERELQKEEERILKIDLKACTPSLRLYYEEIQEGILEKIAERRRKRQGAQP